MRILLDTNVLLRLDDTAHVHHAQALSAIDELHAAGHELVARHDVKGKNAHDARIVAAMERHGVSKHPDIQHGRLCSFFWHRGVCPK